MISLTPAFGSAPKNGGYAGVANATASPGAGDRPAQLDQPDHHIGHEHDLVLVDRPVQAPGGETGERAA